jgi:hypothetical protein
VVDPANWIAATDALQMDDALESATGTILYYKVDASISCKNDNDCDNGNPCDGVEDCIRGDKVCGPGAATVCDDGDPCSEDFCQPSTGTCTASAPDCFDGNPCTEDVCVTGVGCRYEVASSIGTPAELAGNALAAYPFFETPRAFNADAAIDVAVDPGLYPGLAGKTCDVYLTDARGAGGWCSNRQLQDVRGAPDTRSLSAGTIQQNTFNLAAPGALSSDGGTNIGRGYDVVLDCDRDGQLDGNELIDGLGNRAGLYVLGDLTQPGPLPVSQFDDIGPEDPHCGSIFVGGNDDMRIYYPADLDDPGFAGTFPLAVISHGNGHCYDWYDFLGTHLASYGYIAMSHDNDTSPGIETASTTTLEFTDRIIGEQGTLGGGVLQGHIDSSRIAWIGHSRGGEGVTRAFDRLVDEAYPAQNYSAADIVVISSIAPTDFLGRTQSDPHDSNYHLLYGAADGDVCGCPNNSVAQSFGLYERATGPRHSTYIHGADHNDFNCCGTDDFTGPAGTAIGRPEAQQVQKMIHLATLERYVKGSEVAEDLFWRQYEGFRPIGIASSTIVVNEYREGLSDRSFVIDDYQTEQDPAVSSSGGAVTFNVGELAEAQLREFDGSFGWTGAEAMNGMTRARADDDTRAVSFSFTGGGDSFYELEVVAGENDFSDDDWLSFRAAQITRSPETTAALDDLVFGLRLIDGSGGSSSILMDAWGGGSEEPYQRTGYGVGAGWQNEFETIRVRLTDFLVNGSLLDLSDIRAVRFEFGASFGSSEGRIAIDDVELVRD